MKTPLDIQKIPATQDPDQLAAWLQGQIQPHQKLYALLDGALLENLPIEVPGYAPVAHAPLFRVFRKTSLENGGPWLAQIDPVAPFSLKWTCKAALKAPAVLWFQSPLDFSELLSPLAHRMEAQLEDGTEAYLRYYDPRTFTNLLEILKPEQVPFLSLATQWFWLDHAFQHCTLRVALDIPAALALELPLKLDTRQADALVDLSLPYEMTNILACEYPLDLDAIPEENRYPTLKAGVDHCLAKGERRSSEMVRACVEALRQAVRP